MQQRVPVCKINSHVDSIDADILTIYFTQIQKNATFKLYPFGCIFNEKWCKRDKVKYLLFVLVRVGIDEPCIPSFCACYTNRAA